ncbi:RraA family protein [Bacteroidota bacterium]
MSNIDPYKIAERFRHYLRVTDVTDGLDAVGRADYTLMDSDIRPLWFGMQFWGPAVTRQFSPTNQPMPARIELNEALDQHGIWNNMMRERSHRIEMPRFSELIKPGCVVVTSTGGARECGIWGSNNAEGLRIQGAVGIVTEGYARDTDEIILQKTPVACAGIGRTIIPGRTEVINVNVPISCGGVLVRPGDIIGCDWDGVIVVPIEVAEEVLAFAARIAVQDKKSRRRLYERAGREPDESVDWESAAEYFKDLL